MSSGNVMEMERETFTGEGKAPSKDVRSHPTTESPKPAGLAGTQDISTPTVTEERRAVDVSRMANGTHGIGVVELRAPPHRSINAPGPQTFEHKYMPFAAGFAHMALEAAVYRPTRLNVINPTAAVSDDISYYYTLDSGRVPPAALAANPESSAEFVRNTSMQSQGGFFRRMMKPIE